MTQIPIEATLDADYEDRCRASYEAQLGAMLRNAGAGPAGVSLEASLERSGPDMFWGELFVVVQNTSGGQMATAMGSYFGTTQGDELFHPHWRIDCFVRRHELMPEPEVLGQGLATALEAEGVCSQPIWVSWYLAEELGGKARGEVFDLD